MTQPDDSGRSLWGDAPNNETPNRNTSSEPHARSDGRRFGQVAGFVLFLFIVLIIYLLTGRPGEGAKAAAGALTPFQEALSRLLPTLIGIGAFGLLYDFIFVPGSNRIGRVIRSVSTFWLAGLLLSAIAFLVMGWLIPYSAFSERLIIPALLLALAVIMGLFAPIMPIWPLNVPDGQIWTILDFGDHFVTYIGSGVHWVRPLDGFEPFEDAGFLAIEIDDEGFRSHDNFPFRVRAKVKCLFIPTNAEREQWADLRNWSREILQKDIQDEIRSIIQNELSNDLHDHIRAPGNRQTVLHRISIDIKEAIEARSSIGVSLVNTNPINIALLPTDKIATASEYLAAFEAITGGTRRDDLLRMLGTGVNDSRVLSEVVALATSSGDINISFDGQGTPQIALTGGDDLDIGASFSETLIQAANVVMNATNRRLPDSSEPAGELPVPPGKLPEQRALSPGEGWEEVAKPESQIETQQPSPADQPPARSDNAAIHIEPELTEDEVIEVEPDSDGVFKAKPRRNPIIPDDLPDDI